MQNTVECELGMDVCVGQMYQMVLLLIVLCVCIVLVICLFTFLREDKGEQITPLCPQMVVHSTVFSFKMTLAGKLDSLPVLDLDDQLVNRVMLDPGPGAAGGVAQVRMHLQDLHEKTLATVVARDMSMMPQGFTLVRGTTCEVFGYVEPDVGGLYYVRHRTGDHLLTLSGNFVEWDVEGTNPVGLKVCSFRKLGEECVCSVIQQVDAGLVIASLLAIHIHQQLQKSSAMEGAISPRAWPAATSGPESAMEGAISPRARPPATSAPEAYTPPGRTSSNGDM